MQQMHLHHLYNWPVKLKQLHRATKQNYCTKHIFEGFTTLENIAATIKPICTFRLQKCGTLVASLFTLNMNNHTNLKVVPKPTEITFICRQINFTFVAQINLLVLKLEKNETEEFLGQSFLENIRIIFEKMVFIPFHYLSSF